jgi:hypothetical protein
MTLLVILAHHQYQHQLELFLDLFLHQRQQQQLIEQLAKLSTGIFYCDASPVIFQHKPCCGFQWRIDSVRPMKIKNS